MRLVGDKIRREKGGSVPSFGSEFSVFMCEQIRPVENLDIQKLTPFNDSLIWWLFLLFPMEENVALDHSRFATLIFDPVEQKNNEFQ